MNKYVLLVGGGKLGFYLARTLLESGHRVGMIEADGAQAEKVSGELDITVVSGDGTEPETLRDAGIEEAGYLVALTGSDEVNLAVCQMAKFTFHTPEVVARVIDPRNEAIMRRLGVDATISTTALAAQTIEKVLPANGMRLSQIFSQGDLEMAEVELVAGSPVIGKPVCELELPEDSLLIAITRDGRVSLPRGRSVLAEGDRVFALARQGAAGELRLSLLGGSR
jgi:trk system potassium uptake protein TrkA